ncbi:MAG: type II CAAX endopeptidase family protein [Clostridia bacterium]
MKRYAGAARLYLLVVNLVFVANLIISYFNPTDVVSSFLLSALFITVLSIYIPAVFFTRKAKPPEFGTRRISFQQGALSVVIGFGTFLIMSGIMGLFYYFTRDFTMVETGLELPSLLSFAGIAYFFTSCILAPIAEERLFRGTLMFSWLVMGRTKVVLLTAILFALLHMDPLSFIALLFAGIMLGLVAYDSRSIYPAIIAHMTINTVSVIFNEFVPNEYSMFGNELYDALILILFGGAIIFLSYGAFKKRGLQPLLPIPVENMASISAKELQEKGYTVEDIPELFPQISIRKRYILPPLLLSATFLLFVNVLTALYIFGVMS